MRKKVNLLVMAAIALLMAGVSSCDSKDSDPSVAVPTALTVGDLTATTAALSWSGTATSYEVMVGTKTETVNAKTFSATGLTAETEYTWKVRAKEGTDFSAWVDGAKFTTKTAGVITLDPPTALVVGEVTATTAALSWSGAATSYEVMVGTKTETVNAKTFSATELTAETEYTWKVRAKDGADFSTWVDGAKFTTKTAGVITVDPPTNLVAGDVTATTVYLSWIGTTIYYEVMLGTKTQTVDIKLINVQGLAPKTEYTWKVRAKDGVNFSTWVDGPTFTTTEAPSTDIIINDFEVPGANVFSGDMYNPGLSNNFHVTLYEEGLMSTGNGILFKSDFHAPISGSTLSIPEGTYNLASVGGGGNQPMTLDNQYSWYMVITNGAEGPMLAFSSGSAIVSLVGDVYTIEYSFICAKNGYKFLATYVGPLEYMLPSKAPAGAPGQSTPSLPNWSYKSRLAR